MRSTRTFQPGARRRSTWTAPKSRPWFTAFIASGAVLIAAYAAAAFFSSITPTRGAGLVFGILAAVLLGVCMALGLRKRFKHLALGRTMHWLQLHIYAGALFLLLVFMHTGFSLPSGPQTWTILLLTILVSLSGIGGAWLQKWIPHVLASGLHVEAIYERIPELIDGLRAEAEEIVQGSSQTLLDFHRAQLVPALAGPEPGFGFLFDIAGGRTQELMLFTHIAGRLSAPEKEKLDDLKQILAEKNNLDAQMSLQRVLRLWLLVHIPASAILFALVLVHIGAWVYY